MESNSPNYPRGLFSDQMSILGWTSQDASDDVGGAKWALKTVQGPPIKIFVAGLDNVDAVIVQARISVSPEHRKALRQMKPQQRRQVMTRLQLGLLNDPGVEFNMTSEDGQAADVIEVRSVLHQDQWEPAAIRTALCAVRNYGLKVIVLIQDGTAALEGDSIQQISIDPKKSSGTYDSWEANMVVVSSGSMDGLDRLRKQWNLGDVGKVVARLLEEYDNKA